MAKKQAVTTKKAADAVPARVAKPRAPRVTAAKHSKSATPAEPIVAEPVMQESAVSTVQESPRGVIAPREAIAKLAYGYWAARGFQGGSPVEDWLRAEKEYCSR